MMTSDPDDHPGTGGDPPLHMINLDQDLVGHRKFLSCWAHVAAEPTFVVDPGPRASIERVITELRDQGVTRLDYILLTHVHLDHAGGTAELAAAFPTARIVCHPRGARHMITPDRLWESSQKVLGHVADAYGVPSAVATTRFVAPTEATSAGIAVLPTPGHGAHHYSYLFGRTLYVGEAAGLRIPLPGAIYLRPATPTRFRLEAALESIDLLLGLDPPPRRMAYPHFGLVEDPASYLRWNREQLTSWVTLLRRLLQDGLEDPVLRAHELLLEGDRHCRNFPRLDPDIQEREHMYVRQTMEGLLEYIRSLETV